MTKLLKSLTKKDYADAIDRFVQRCEGDGIRTIYEFGSVGAPGISDIDVIIGTKEDVDQRAIAFDYRTLVGMDRYVFIHPPFVLPINILNQFKKLLPTEELIKRKGESVIFEKPTIGNLLHLAWHLVSSRYYDWPFTCVIDENNLREYMPTISAVKWTINVARTLAYECGLRPGMEQEEYLYKAIEDLRREFIRMGDDEILENINKLLPEIRRLHLRLFEIVDFIVKNDNNKQIKIYYTGFGPDMNLLIFLPGALKRQKLGVITILPHYFYAGVHGGEELEKKYSGFVERREIVKSLDKWVEHSHLYNYKIGIISLRTYKPIKYLLRSAYLRIKNRFLLKNVK